MVETLLNHELHPSWVIAYCLAGRPFKILLTINLIIQNQKHADDDDQWCHVI